MQEITGQKVPHVDGWFFTHPHCDHMDAFFYIMENCPDAIDFDHIYCHFPSVQYLSEEGDSGDKTLSTFICLSPAFAQKIRPVSVNDTYRFGTALVEILYTADCRITENKANNASTVLKLTLGEKTVLFLGDLGVEGGELLLAAKKDALKSDFCQMAHHGQNGVDFPVYQAIAPTACLWCTPEWLWNNDRGKGFNTHIYQTVTVRNWMEQLGVKEHYVIKDGDHAIEF